MLTLIAKKIMPNGLTLIDYKLVSVLTLIANKIVPIGLVLIDYKLVSVLTLIANEIVPISLSLIDYKLVSVLTLIVDEILSSLTLIAKLHGAVPGLIQFWTKYITLHLMFLVHA